MPASGPPSKSLGMPTGSMEQMAARLKALSKGAREADRDMEKAAKKGGAVSKEMIENAKKAHAAVADQERQIRKVESVRERNARRLDTDRDNRNPIAKGYGEAHEGLERIERMWGGVKKIYNAFDDHDLVKEQHDRAQTEKIERAEGVFKHRTPIRGPSKFTTVGEGLEGLGTIIPGKYGEAIKTAGKVSKMVGGVIEAQDARKDGIQHAQQAMNDSGLGGDATALRSKISNKESWLPTGGLKLKGDAPALTPEMEKAIDAKVDAAIAKAQSFKKAGYEQLGLGNMDAARKNFQAANGEVKGSVPAYFDPGAMWDEEQARAKMRANQGIDRMGIRTASGRDD